MSKVENGRHAQGLCHWKFVSLSSDYNYKGLETESLILIKYIKRLDGAARHCANILFVNVIKEYVRIS